MEGRFQGRAARTSAGLSDAGWPRWIPAPPPFNPDSGCLYPEKSLPGPGKGPWKGLGAEEGGKIAQSFDNREKLWYTPLEV